MKIKNKSICIRTLHHKPRLTIESIEVILLEVSAFFSTMGTTIFGIDVGIGYISLFRLFFLVEVMIFFLSKLSVSRAIILNKNASRSVCLISVWLLYAVLSLLWSRDIAGYFRILFFIVVGFILVIIMLDVCNHRDVERVMMAFNLGLLVQAIIGAREYLTGDYKYISEYTLNFYISRGYRYPIAMMFNPNDFSTGMYFAAMISLYFIFRKGMNRLMRIMNSCMFLLYSFLIVIGGSRAVLIGLFLSLLFVIFSRQKKVVKCFIVIATLIIVALPWTMQIVLSHVDLGYFQTQGESFSTRSNLIKNGLTFLLKTFGFGVGNGQIEYWMRNYAIYPVKEVENMHNFWAEMLTGYGILIFAGFLVFYIKMTYDFYLEYKRNVRSQNAIQSLVMAGSLIGFVFASISSSSNLSKEYVWVFFAICIVLQRDVGKSEGNVFSLSH